LNKAATFIASLVNLDKMRNMAKTVSTGQALFLEGRAAFSASELAQILRWVLSDKGEDPMVAERLAPMVGCGQRRTNDIA
jgi:hypothetical protein